MSFRARLTIFFVVIVVVPMAAIGVLMFSLINDSQQGKADARAGGIAATAGSLYQSEAGSARGDAAALARAVGSLDGKLLSARWRGRLASRERRWRTRRGPLSTWGTAKQSRRAPQSCEIQTVGQS